MLTRALQPLDSAKEVEALWAEYEARATPEAQLVKELDLLDMVVQAHTYEKKYRDRNSPHYNSSVEDLEPFFQSTKDRITQFASLVAVDHEIRSNRRPSG